MKPLAIEFSMFTEVAPATVITRPCDAATFVMTKTFVPFLSMVIAPGLSAVVPPSTSVVGVGVALSVTVTRLAAVSVVPAPVQWSEKKSLPTNLVAGRHDDELTFTLGRMAVVAFATIDGAPGVVIARSAVSAG